MRKQILTIVSLVLAAAAYAGTPTMDGVLDASAGYTLLTGAATPDLRAGFGTAIDASEVWWTQDATNLYLFVQSRVNTGSDDGIMVLINTSNQTGAAAGTSLGNIGSSGHAFASANTFKMEFEVDRGYVANPGNNATNFWINTANWVGGTSGGYFGNPGSAGSPLTSGGETHAFSNAGNSGGLGSSTGWEMAIPRSSLGGLVNGDKLQVFAIVVSSTAWFSDDSAPASISSGNAGNSPDFSTIAGDQFSPLVSVPVVLSKFSAD